MAIISRNHDRFRILVVSVMALIGSLLVQPISSTSYAETSPDEIVITEQQSRDARASLDRTMSTIKSFNDEHLRTQIPVILNHAKKYGPDVHFAVTTFFEDMLQNQNQIEHPLSQLLYPLGRIHRKCAGILIPGELLSKVFTIFAKHSKLQDGLIASVNKFATEVLLGVRIKTSKDGFGQLVFLSRKPGKKMIMKTTLDTLEFGRKFIENARDYFLLVGMRDGATITFQDGDSIARKRTLFGEVSRFFSIRGTFTEKFNSMPLSKERYQAIVRQAWTDRGFVLPPMVVTPNGFYFTFDGAGVASWLSPEVSHLVMLPGFREFARQKEYRDGMTELFIRIKTLINLEIAVDQ